MLGVLQDVHQKTHPKDVEISKSIYAGIDKPRGPNSLPGRCEPLASRTRSRS